MGVVYLAHNALMGRDEVLKVIGRQIMDSPELRERFLREIRAVARLHLRTSSPPIPPPGSARPIVFAMEYVEGLDLSRLVQTKGPLPVAHGVPFHPSSGPGLQHATKKKLIHRDIKPGNLMVSGKGDKATVKILDFGLAKATREQKVDSKLTSADRPWAPPTTSPPSRSSTPRVSTSAPTSTVWAARSTTCSPAAPPSRRARPTTSTRPHLPGRRSPELDPPDVPAELAALVAKMMAKDPSQRFQTPGEVAQALTPFLRKGMRRSSSLRRAARSPVRRTPMGAVGAGYAATQLETEDDRRVVRPRKAAGPPGAESRWESMIDFREPESSPEAEPESAPWRPPAWIWPR